MAGPDSSTVQSRTGLSERFESCSDVCLKGVIVNALGVIMTVISIRIKRYM